MSRRSRSLVQRARDHVVFSVVAIGVLFIVLRLLGMRSTVAGFVFSVGITLALNVGLSYYNDYRARSPRRRPAPAGGGDIRWREEAPARSGSRPPREPFREAELRSREEDLRRRELELRRREERDREKQS